MILESAIVKITRGLQLITEKESVSSNVNIKEKSLTCLAGLVKEAPLSEFEGFSRSEHYNILTGYLANTLCQLLKNDKSKEVKIQSLEAILIFVTRLEELHGSDVICERCCLDVIVEIIPGVSSTLFRLLMSDAKLPRRLLTLAMRTLAKVVVLAVHNCKFREETSKNLEEVCDNIAVRFSFLIDYVANKSNELPRETKIEALKFCQDIVCKTNVNLLSKTSKSIVQYTAFITCHADMPAEVELQVMILVESIKDRMTNSDLDSTVLKCLFNIMKNLDDNYSEMLVAERETEIAMMSGLLKLMPQESMTTFLELQDKRETLIRLLTKLCEFSTQQPFFFLTESEVDDRAIESHEKINTVEKHFINLTDRELKSITICCHLIGRTCRWFQLDDLIRCHLRQFDNPSNLFITRLILEGCLDRVDIECKTISKFAIQSTGYYLNQMRDIYLTILDTIDYEDVIYSQESLKVVIGLETLVTLVSLYIRSNVLESSNAIILKDLICPLLNLSSSSLRTISLSSLSALSQISDLYKVGSIKNLISANIDYIVDGISHMLENFTQNPEIANVLAIALKLSSIDTFYYFKDIYERIFKILARCYHTKSSKSIAILFHRTLQILSQWKAVSVDQSHEDPPVSSPSGVDGIRDNLDIDRRINRLNGILKNADKIMKEMEEPTVCEVDESDVMKEIQEGKVIIPEDPRESAEKPAKDEAKDEKPMDVVLTEKIIKLCVHLMSSNYVEVKIQALKAVTCGFSVLRDDENTLLPLVHKVWSPLIHRLTGDYSNNLELNLCAFDCLMAMALYAKDFIKRRTLDSIIPKLCQFLEVQSSQSLGKKEYGPYCMTLAYKCQLRVLTHLGKLAFEIELAYDSLWRVIEVALIYLHPKQVSALREAARVGLLYMISLDPDCVWYFSKLSGHLEELPFDLIYDPD